MNVEPAMAGAESMSGEHAQEHAGVVVAGGYQVAPEMDAAQFAALKQDIAERGVVQPIDVDEHGHILDGHHRHRACCELGITNFPVFVRPGLSEVEKRTFARQVNTLRRHLTRAQLRALIAGQLRDTPTWSDARIARALGTSDKTVRAVRRQLEATSEIPRLTAFEGADGKARPSTQPPRAIFVPNVRDLTFEDLVRLSAQAATLSPEERRAFWTAQGVAVVVDEAYNPFAGCTEAEQRHWHLFVLFLVQHCGWSVDGAAMHAEWVLRRPFTTVAEWLGEVGSTWRRGVGLRDVPATTIQAWTAFAADRTHLTSPEIERELRALNPAFDGASPVGARPSDPHAPEEQP